MSRCPRSVSAGGEEGAPPEAAAEEPHHRLQRHGGPRAWRQLGAGPDSSV